MRPLFPTRLALIGLAAAALTAQPAYAQITSTNISGLSNGARVYRSNVAYDSVHQVYLVITQRPPVSGRFLDRTGAQIGGDFTIASENAYTGWASIAFGGPQNDPVFVVTYIEADQVTNPKWGRLVRYVPGSSPTVSGRIKIADVNTEWLFGEKAQNVWNGNNFIIGTRIKDPGMSQPAPIVTLMDVNGNISTTTNLGDGTDYQGSPAIACAIGGVCLAVGFQAGIPTGYTGGTWGRMFDSQSLAPQGSLFRLAVFSPNEDQGVAYLAHTGFFLAEWFRGGGPGYIDTRLVAQDGTMGALDQSLSIGPGAGCNQIVYNPGTQTSLLLTKGPSAELLAIELGDDGHPIRPNNILTLTGWDGSVLDYLPSIGMNALDGQWLVTAETTGSALGWKVSGTLVAQGANLPISIVSNQTLPQAVEQAAYTNFMLASGSTLPYVWTLVSGTLPPGINITTTSLQGTPTVPGTYNFRLRVTGADAQFAERDFSLTVNQIITAGNGPSGASISNKTSDIPLYPGHAYRHNAAWDGVNQVYMVIVDRPPVTGRFYNKLGQQIGQDFVIATEGGFTAWASIAAGGPSNDPAFIVTYVTSADPVNPKTARLVRYVPGNAPNISGPIHVADVGSEWLFAEKAESVWNGSSWIIGTRVKNPGASLPTFQVQKMDMSGNLSGAVDLGNGQDYYGSPSVACAANNTCIAVGFMAGIASGYSGGSYARLFNGSSLAAQGNLFFLASGNPNEDQSVVYQSHTGNFLAQWFRGSQGGFIDTRLIGTNGTMSALDLSRGFAGPGSGTNAAAYNPLTRTTLLLAKDTAASLYAMELGDNGYPLNTGNWILLTPWDGAVLDYLPSVAANGTDGDWLTTWELNGGGFMRIIHGTPQGGPICSYSLSPTSNNFAPGGGSSSFGMTAPNGCVWSAGAGTSWIHTSSSGSGNGTISYSVDPNGGVARSGSIIVGGQTFSISQSAISCSYSLSPGSSGMLNANGTGGLVLVTATSGCSWAPSTGQGWIHASGSGSGNGTVGYTVDPNAGSSRSGSIVIGGQTFAVSQAGGATPTKASITSPAASSTLSGSTVTFQWNAGVGVSAYWLYVGTTTGGYELFSYSAGTNQSVQVTGLPTDGSTVTVRLLSNMSGAWQFNDYTYTAATASGGPQRAQLTSPAPSSTLTGTTATFQWTGGTSVTQYWLDVGTSFGGNNIYTANQNTNLSTTVPGLPSNGSTVYVRLFSKITGNWQYNDYTLTAFTPSSGPTKAQLTSPAPSSTLTSSTVNFQWNAGVGVSAYWLYVGSSVGSFDIASRNPGTNLSSTVSGLPTNGSTLYVRLLSSINGAWQFNDYTLTAATQAGGPQKAQLTSPAPSSTLTGSTVTFQWTGGTSVTQYWLDIGTSAGGTQLYSQNQNANLSTSVSGLPTNGSTIYVRLHSNIAGAWQFNDYTLTASNGSGSGPQKAQLTSPAPSSTLSSSTVTFQWTGGVGVSAYWLYVGSTVGGYEIASKNPGTNLSTTVSGIPTDGSTLNVRLLSNINGAWQFNDYTLTAATQAGGPQRAQLTSPAPGSTLSASTVTFQWTGGTSVTQYWLDIGTSAGGTQLYSQNQGTNLSTSVAGLPTNGSVLYVRLHSNIGGVWQYNDYTLTASSSGSGPQKAQLTSPAASSTLTASTVTFQWTGGSGVASYWLYVGSVVGGWDIASKNPGTNLSSTVSGLPTDGSTLYVRLLSSINGAWQFNDYTVTAATIAGGPQRAQLTSPSPGSALNSTSVTFQWTQGTNVTQYWLDIGTTVGGNNIASINGGSNLSTIVNNLPTNHSTLYVRLYSNIGGVWQYIDYTLTSLVPAPEPTPDN